MAKKSQAFSNRRGERVSKLGRELERRIERVGQDLVGSGRLDSFTLSAPHSVEDCQGRDFTACLAGVERSFGVTLSAGSAASWDRFLYPEHPQWYVPWNTKDETIARKILGLFS